MTSFLDPDWDNNFVDSLCFEVKYHVSAKQKIKINDQNSEISTICDKYNVSHKFEAYILNTHFELQKMHLIT